VSPRKSSTSSGKRPPRARPRYLGLEVAGEPFPPATRWWETTLRDLLDRSAVTGRFRLVRTDGYRAIVEVDHRLSATLRVAWTTELEERGHRLRLGTRRTWGTLRGAKAWLRGPTAPLE
jgi:RNase P/RNase MRP subunit POP5